MWYSWDDSKLLKTAFNSFHPKACSLGFCWQTTNWGNYNNIHLSWLLWEMSKHWHITQLPSISPLSTTVLSPRFNPHLHSLTWKRVTAANLSTTPSTADIPETRIHCNTSVSFKSYETWQQEVTGSGVSLKIVQPLKRKVDSCVLGEASDWTGIGLYVRGEGIWTEMGSVSSPSSSVK